MSINPAEYDLRELRRLAGVAEDETLSERRTDRQRRGAGPGTTSDGDHGSTPGDDATATDPTQASVGELSRHLFAGALEPGAVVRWNRYEELLEYQLRATRDMLTQPYLTELPESYTGVAIVFEWLEFMLSKAGEDRTTELLAYYRSIGWISRDAEKQLQSYLGGLADPQPDLNRGLSKDDHRLCLLYIVRLLAELHDMR